MAARRGCRQHQLRERFHVPKPPTAMAGHAQAVATWNVSRHCFLRDYPSHQQQWRDMHKPCQCGTCPAIASCHQAVPPLLPARQVHLARALFVSHLQARLNHLLATICRLGLNHLQARSCSCARRVTCIQCGLQSAWLNGQTTSCNFGLVTCML